MSHQNLHPFTFHSEIIQEVNLTDGLNLSIINPSKI